MGFGSAIFYRMNYVGQILLRINELLVYIYNIYIYATSDENCYAFINGEALYQQLKLDITTYSMSN
jgi:hypothetical protein